MTLVSARDVQRVFRTWLDLSKDEEVLALFALVQDALSRRGYALRGEWVKPDRSRVEEKKEAAS